jgi:hypothetical protein
VWPLKVAIQTPVVAGRLCTSAFDDELHFPELVGAIIPLACHADGGRLDLPRVRDEDKLITKNYPDQVLELLGTVLPDEVTHWSSGVNETLERMTKDKPAFVADPRMIRLRHLGQTIKPLSDDSLSKI